MLLELLEAELLELQEGMDLLLLLLLEQVLLLGIWRLLELQQRQLNLSGLEELVELMLAGMVQLEQAEVLWRLLVLLVLMQVVQVVVVDSLGHSLLWLLLGPLGLKHLQKVTLRNHALELDQLWDLELEEVAVVVKILLLLGFPS